MRTVCVTLMGILLALSASAQQALTNDAVIKLVKAGLGEDLIVGMINSQPGQYSVDANSVIALKNAKVSDKVIAAMMAKAAAAPTAPAAPAAPTAADFQPGVPDVPYAAAPSPGAADFKEVGVYYKKQGKWMELLPEVVNWKTGGTIKTIASVGVVKKDINGNLPGPHSRNSVNTPLEFVISMPEGVAITEYQLIRLRINKDYREFRTVTGGVFNQKSGAMRDMVPFEGKKMATRLYGVILPENLGAGDYGFIYLGAAGGAGGMSSLSMGKMYTFRIVE
jgi:hypothetical protein